MIHKKFYRPLPKGHFTRLIELQPGCPLDRIEVRLSVIHIYDAPQFEALSYVWGNPHNTTKITCDGHDFDVTINLQRALLRARYIDRPRLLWADAVCINQHDLEERGTHVAYMGRIYEKSDVVLIHLAEDTQGNERAVKELVEQVGGLIKRYDGDIDAMLVLDADDPFLEDKRWVFLASMLQCRWFTRAWVVQEIGLARDPRIWYGDVEFSYRDVTRLAGWQQRCAPQLMARAGLEFNTIHIEWLDWTKDPEALGKAPDRTFLELMNQASWLGCSDHRDHIYSLLGHPLARLPGSERLIVTPDYKKPVPDVYHELVMNLLQGPGGLRVLSAVEHSEQPPTEFPSWVSLWTEGITMCNLGIFPGFYYNASRGLDEPRPSILGTSLRLRGLVLDVVARAYPFSDQDVEFPRQTGTLDVIWDDVVQNNSATQYSGAEKVDSFSLTLVAGLSGYDEAETPKALPRHRSNFSAYWRYPSASHSRSSSSGDAETFWTGMRLTSTARSFFTTEKHYFGLGPRITQPGDRCVVFAGARVPFIIRKAPDRENCWRLVGECYIHGIMRGEAGQLAHEGRISPEDIVLC
ncbi:heterokaryon incompatibility protein-domain-containing protein [Diaporthe sp. PMI_573]|nr:heterokaryon incompatibility protein-domain-containing protein [Diaporthaceae sp. PMI_573]